MRRPGLPRPWRWRLGRKNIDGDTVLGQAAHEEDQRLLRRTRLRLMGVSGAVTLVILVVLGAGTYAVVARVLGDSDQKTFQAYVDRHIQSPNSSGPETTALSGDGALVFEIDIRPDRAPSGPRYQQIPVGLPDQASLAAAVANATHKDERTITASDGSTYHVESIQVTFAPDNVAGIVQIVQNRTAEVRLLNTLLWGLIGGGLGALMAALLAGYLYAGRALVPIRASIDRRQEALQRQREFAANASHELRTPLTVIGASVEDLKRNRSARVEDVGEALGDIEAEVRQMAALVEDMLLLARTDSNVVQIERVPLDLGDVAADAATMLVTLGEERGVNFVLDPLPAPVTGDPLRLRQLVTILVDNAIRHSPAGSTVEARVRPAAGAAVLQVDDHGPGIRPDDLPRLFERFWRADDAPPGGTGLGLAIAKWIVEQHGGTIGAVNLPGGGASFTVWLPSVPVPDVAAEATPKWTPPDEERAGSGTLAVDPPKGPAGI
jgi:signal transduction histidine kinase